MTDYKKIDITHRLSSYGVILPVWNGGRNTWTPFKPWATGKPLAWYQAYNATKHDRHTEFQRANFEHLIDACAGLLAILSAQFETNDFSPGPFSLTTEGPNDGTELGIGGYFLVKFPYDWPTSDRYDFDWHELKADLDPFQKFDYSKVP